MPVFLHGRDAIFRARIKMVVNQYVTTIMGGREVSRPYRAFTTLRFVGRRR